MVIVRVVVVVGPRCQAQQQHRQRDVAQLHELRRPARVVIARGHCSAASMTGGVMR
jgi:coenzyme F420-reducing hydrogenase gamma subunit